MLSLIFLIPQLPLLGAAINGLLDRRMRSERMVGGLACAAVLLAFLLSLVCVIQLATGLESFEANHPANVHVDGEARSVEVTVAPWFMMGSYDQPEIAAVLNKYDGYRSIFAPCSM